jgi:hypothetical protein
VDNKLYSDNFLDEDYEFRIREKAFNRNRYFSKLIFDYDQMPSLILDFRYAADENSKIGDLKFMIKQTQHVIADNIKADVPFKLNFCSYEQHTKLHELYTPSAQFKKNFIFVHEKSYLDIFPENKLIYVDQNANETMEKYDKNMVYVLGVNKGALSKYTSFTQAKKDRIKCVKLPYEYYGHGKPKNMPSMFNILLSLNAGQSWEKAFFNLMQKQAHLKKDS